jgi:hypothetical protein
VPLRRRSSALFGISIIVVATPLLVLAGHAELRTPAGVAPSPASDYPVCLQPALQNQPLPIDPPGLEYQVFVPAVFGSGSDLPACNVYCGLLLEDDPHRPPGYQTYFADEFDCDRLLDYWTVQATMTPASYTPPASGYVQVSEGTLRVGVPDADTSFPYLYMVDEAASTYDVAHAVATGDWAPRVDWVPAAGDFRLALRLRFNVEDLGEHPISVYADGHRPAYAGPLFYVGTDYNSQQEAWRGLIVGADRANSFVDLGDLGYTDPYTDWLTVSIDFNSTADTFALAVDGSPTITRTLSDFKGFPEAAIRPDTLYLGSLALLEAPTAWTDLELDWIRVYAPQATPEATFGLQQATVETPPAPGDAPTPYSIILPPGPFANSPHWSEDFDQPGTVGPMPDYWQLVQDPDPASAWTEVISSQVALRNNGFAVGVPVWAIFDDILPDDILAGLEVGPESPLDYLRRRGGSPFFPVGDGVGPAADYPRFDWRPNAGNVRYAWRGRQTANGYGVEISNGGHFPYFTGALFYTLVDTTANDGQGQFIFPGCQEQYFWRLHLLADYAVPDDGWTIVSADYVNGTVHLYADGQQVGWWPESDCSLNWYLKGENATSPDVLFFGNPATAPAGSWSEVFIDWFATFPGLPREP